MPDSTDIIFEKVSDIICDRTGADRRHVTMGSDLCFGLGVAGDDGDYLFEAFDEAFEVDWTGLELGIHFGNEGFGLPGPWRLTNNCVMYEQQPCRVSDVVRAVETGRWHGTKMILLPKSERIEVYVKSGLWFSLFLLPVLAVLGISLKSCIAN